MANSPSQHRQSEPNTKTEADMKSVDGKSGKTQDGSQDAKSHTKAGSNEGAGGGKKQERNH